MPWLLDTNVWIYYLKNAEGPVLNHLRRHPTKDIRICSIVRAELLHGAMKYSVPERRIAIVRETVAPYDSLPFDDQAANAYAALRHQLETTGKMIGSNDAFIAAICLAHGCTLVTSNTNEFSRVAGLTLEDWMI